MHLSEDAFLSEGRDVWTDFPDQASIGLNRREHRRGMRRRSDPEMRRFIQIARGSASELEYHLLLANDLHFLAVDEFATMELKILEIQRMLAALAQRLQRPVLART